MPFTLAHPVAVIPMARSPLILSALVMGSFVPDFEYFFRLAPVSLVSHSGPGLLSFCLPAGLIAFWLWHWVLKRPLVELLPVAHYQRLLPFCGSPQLNSVKRLIWISFSLLLGASTHLLWDSFTHPGGWAVDHIPALETVLVQTRYGSLRLYKVFQHGSTLIGIILLACLYMHWFRRTEAQDNMYPSLTTKSRIRIIGLILGSAGLFTLVFAWATSPSINGFPAFRIFAVRAAIAGISSTSIALVVYSTAWIFGKKNTQPAA